MTKRTNNRVSVLIPSRDEPYLVQTVADLLANAAGDVEIVVALDGPQHCGIPRNAADKRIILIDLPRVVGRRAAMEAAAAAATGKWLMKIDAHCRVGEAWDEILKENCQDNWIVVPRRYFLDPEKWEISAAKGCIDAMYYAYPFGRPFNPILRGVYWPERGDGREQILIDEDMAENGACYFMRRSLWEWAMGDGNPGYGTFYAEMEEILLPVALGEPSGGLVRNKKTWFAHWGKPNSLANGRLSDPDFLQGVKFVFDYWWNNRDRRQVRTYQDYVEEWIDRAGPLPGYPEGDWQTRHLDALKRYGT